MKDGRFFKFSAGLLSALALIALIAVPACKGKSGTKTGQTGAAGKVNQTIIAHVGNKDVVTWEEFNDTYHIDRMGRSLTPEQLQKLLDNLINQHLVYLDGLEKGYDKNPEIVEQVQRTERQLISRYVIKDLSQQAPQVTDQQMKDYYDKNPDKFKTTNIEYMVFNERKYNGDREKTKAACEQALAQVKAGADIATLSQTMLERKTPLTMTVRKDQKSFYGPEFDEAVWSTGEGQVSPIIESSQGFIFFKVIKRETQSYEQAQPFIRNELTQGAGRNRVEDFYAELRKKYPINVDQGVLDAKVPKNTLGAPGAPGMMPPGAPGMAPGAPGMMPPGRPGMPPGAPGMMPPGRPGTPPGAPGGMPPGHPSVPPMTPPPGPR